MKLHKLLLVLFAFSLTFATNFATAQDDDMSSEEEMTMEQWQAQMDELTVRKNDLMNQLNGLNRDVDALRKQSSDLDAGVTKGENDLYGSVGSTKTGVAEYRGKFEAVEKMVNSLNCGSASQSMIDSVNKQVGTVGASKIRCLNEFWDRYTKMTTKMASCKPAGPSGYTVVKGDCLWKIAGMSNIYGNPRLWPALWEANRDGISGLTPTANKRTAMKVTNPNLIYPGQILKVPALTDAQKKDYLAKKYSARNWRSGSTRKSVTTTTKTTTKTDEKTDTKK